MNGLQQTLLKMMHSYKDFPTYINVIYLGIYLCICTVHYSYIFLQYIKAAKKTELPLLRLVFAMREFYFFFFYLSMWVSHILERDSNSCLTLRHIHANYLYKAHGRNGVVLLTVAAINHKQLHYLTTLHFSRKKHALDPASPRQL